MPARFRIIPPADHIRFGSFLREIREEKGISQRTLAKRLGISQSLISKVESGDRQLQVLELIEIGRNIGVSASEIIEGFLASGQSNPNKRRKS